MATARVSPAAEGFTFGCDPEAFIINADGKYVSAAGLIPGTKEEPYPVKYGAVQVDGMAAEFNIDPAATFAEFNRNINAVIGQLESMLPEGHKLSFVPAVRFDPEVFAATPEEAKMLGCNPDFNAWTGEMNMPPEALDDPTLRTASGHIHVGWGSDLDVADDQHLLNCMDLTKQMDWFLGAWSIKMDPDPTRRKLYGRAGAFRPKVYGVEYRVLSNFWVTDRERRLMVWNRMQLAIASMRKRFMPDAVPSSDNDNLVSYINEAAVGANIESNYMFPIRTINPAYSRF